MEWIDIADTSKLIIGNDYLVTDGRMANVAEWCGEHFDDTCHIWQCTRTEITHYAVIVLPKQ